jgi:hypothetical protein
VALATAAGLGLGVLAGLVGGELLGDLGTERVKGAVRRISRSERAVLELDPQDVERAVTSALAEHPKASDLAVGVRALGDGVVELSGTVPDNAARRIAAKIARGVAGAQVVVNRILVEGDDVPRRHSPPSSAS